MANGDTELLRQIHERILAMQEQLGELCSQEDCDLNEKRIHKLEERTSSMVAKQAGMAGVVSGLMLALKQFIVGE